MRLTNKISKISIIDLIVISAFFLLLVFPNSFREIKVPLLCLLFIVSLKDVLSLNKKVFVFYLLGVFVTFLYLIIGLKGAKLPNESTNQVIIVYVLAPFMWIGIANYIFERYSLSTIIKGLNVYAILGCISVFVGIWLFNIGRLDLLEYILDTPNKTLTDEGVIEMKLFVYGSLIFLIPAFIQQYNSSGNRVFYFVTLIIFFITVVVSGRAALLLSIFWGVFSFILFNKDVYLLKISILSVLVFLVSIFILREFNISIVNILNDFYLRLTEREDTQRMTQLHALVEGINNNIFGAGHGVGVDYIRSYKFPWRYEILPIAIIYRVSIIGFVIYALPFLYSFYKFIRLKGKNVIDKYMLVGYISMIIASFTNPYLESFEFNFFYVFPFIYFIKRRL